MENRVLIFFFKETNHNVFYGKTKPNRTVHTDSTTHTMHTPLHKDELHISTGVTRVTGWGLTLPATELLGRKCVKSL